MKEWECPACGIEHIDFAANRHEVYHTHTPVIVDACGVSRFIAANAMTLWI